MLRWLVPIALLAALPAFADGPHDFADVEKAAAQAVADGTVPSLAIAIAHDGEIVYERAFGLADVEAQVAATTRTAYPLASATKPITATALMVLHERGAVDLSAPVDTHLPSLHLHDAAGDAARVDLLQLLGHTSGLGTYARIDYGEAIANSRPFDDEVRRHGVLVNPPGRVAEYSNLGYGLIGDVIAHRSGKSFATFVDEAVFRPLGMRDSFIDAPLRPGTAVAAGYDATSVRLPALRNNTPGAGNAHASVHDLLRFGMFHLEPGRVADAPLSRGGVARMQANPDPGAFQHYYGDAFYGLGWYVRPDDGGHRTVWHEGGMPGASTIIKLLPEHGIAAVVLSNRTDANDLTQSLADRMIRVLLPGYRPTPLDPVAGYSPYVSQPAFRGRWVGTIIVDGIALDCTLALDADGGGTIRYVDPARPDDATEADFRAIVNGDSLVGAFPGRLPTEAIGGDDAPLLLLKLVRTQDRLSGAIVAYGSPQRLQYLLPFAIQLERASR